MTEQHRYTYVVLRYVHDVVTGEFINVGLVMHSSEAGFVKSQVRTSIGRIKNVFPDFERDAFLRVMKSVDRSISSYRKRCERGDLLDRNMDAASIGKFAVVHDDSSLQWSSLGGGVSKNLDGTFARLYERLVSKYDVRSSHRRTDDEIWRPVRQLLEERNVPVNFEEKTVSGKTDEISFKRAWKNGVWHAYEALSFDLADADGIKDKARRWRGHLEAVHDGSPENINLNFVVGAPRNESLRNAYDGALKILQSAPFSPRIYEESEVPKLVDRIEDEVREHLQA